MGISFLLIIILVKTGIKAVQVIQEHDLPERNPSKSSHIQSIGSSDKFTHSATNQGKAFKSCDGGQWHVARLQSGPIVSVSSLPSGTLGKILEKSYSPQSTSGFSVKHYAGGHKAVAAKHFKINVFLLLLYASYLEINNEKVIRLNLVPANLQRFSPMVVHSS